MHCGPGPTGWTLKSALAALPHLEIAPLFLAHGALPQENLKWLISGPNATVDNLETAPRLTLGLSCPFNLAAAYVFAVPTSTIGQLVGLPRGSSGLYCIGAIPGGFAWASVWLARSAAAA